MLYCRKPVNPSKCDWRPLSLDDPRAGLTLAFWNTFRRLQLAFGTVTAQEASQGWRYEYIVRIRPDAEFATPLPFNVKTASKDVITVFSADPEFTSVVDHFAVVPRSMADIYFNTADVYHQCLPKSMTKTERDRFCIHPNADVDPDFAPECYLSKWLKDHGVLTQQFNYPVETLVRGDKSRRPHDFVNVIRTT